ncbi:hypothetical protein DNR41_27350, partial [Escherichia coli]
RLREDEKKSMSTVVRGEARKRLFLIGCEKSEGVKKKRGLPDRVGRRGGGWPLRKKRNLGG